MTCKHLGLPLALALSLLAATHARAQAVHPAADPNTGVTDPLVRVLIAKGLLTTEEARSVSAAATPVEQRDHLAALLRDKGLISSAEYEAVRAVAPADAATTPHAERASELAGAQKPDASQVAQKPAAAPTPAVIAAIAPTRLLQVDPPKREGLIPDLKLGSGARVKFYGIFKTSIIHDSSSPQGNDFPLPLLAADTGPNNSPEFHIRARGLRLGANFEWLDPAPKTAITGRIEFDFEGDFTRAAPAATSSRVTSSTS